MTPAKMLRIALAFLLIALGGMTTGRLCGETMSTTGSSTGPASSAPGDCGCPLCIAKSQPMRTIPTTTICQSTFSTATLSERCAVESHAPTRQLSAVFLCGLLSTGPDVVELATLRE
jgi:hypothetical protein